MRRFIVFLIVGAILLIASEAAIGGITYPRNQMSILETRLNAHPWDDPFASNIGIRVSTISRPSDIEVNMDSQPTIRNIRFAGPLFIRLVVTYWNIIISDYETNREPIVIIKD